LLKCAKEKYDFIILDLSSNIFLDSTKWALKESTNIMFVTENTNVCLKKSMQILDTCFNNWNVYKEKFRLVFNRVSKGIDEDIFSNVLKIKSLGKIKSDSLDNSDLYDRILESLKYIPKKSLIDKIKNNTKMVASFVGIMRS
jgi:Flp pilus assembly CpaE family ATPase